MAVCPKASAEHVRPSVRIQVRICCVIGAAEVGAAPRPWCEGPPSRATNPLPLAMNFAFWLCRRHDGDVENRRIVRTSREPRACARFLLHAAGSREICDYSFLVHQL